MICWGIGLDEDTVIRYFAAAKNPAIRGVRQKNIRTYLDNCCFPINSFHAEKYHIQDPFSRAMIIPNAVLFSIEYEEHLFFGEIIEIQPIPKRYVEDITDMTPLCRNTAYSYIVGLWKHEYTPCSATIEYLVETGVL